MFGVLKKARTEEPKAEAPRIFVPFRAIGYVTNEVPFNIQARGQAYFLTTCVGTTYHMYDVEKMNLLFVGPHTSTPITALATLGDVTFVACGSEIVSYKRSKEIGRFSCGDAPNLSIASLEIFGQHIISICSDNSVKLHDHTTGELYTTIDFDPSFTVTTLIHPSTYLNKILIGSNQGTMQIWNIRTSTMIYSFEAFSSPITCFTQTPVVDVIAVGLLDGSIIIRNIRTDATIMTMKQEGKVTSISFRTDDLHVMASANMYGDIALWDLDRQRILHVMKGAHDGAIPSIQFLNGQAILMSSGADNSVKQWIFDSLDGLPRLLKSRSGHHAPPTHIRFYSEDGHFILSAGRDRSLRSFSVVRDSQSVELSQGSLSKKSKLLNLKIDELKLPLITSAAASPAKEKEWDNILTAHWNEPGVRTWSYKRKALGSYVMNPKDGSATKAVAISTCGNFGFIGSALGGVDMFNMQSGLFRRSFEDAHKKAVTGLQSDRLNRILISGSLDGQLKMWDIKSGKCEHSMDMAAPITHLLLYTENNHLAVVCDDLCIRIVDVENRRVVREFWGHSNRITDLTFSPDGHWLVSASLDATIRTWDLPTGHMVDIFKCESIATSVTFSPTGDYLATAHVDNVGIFLWANRMQFTTVSLRSISDDDVVRVALPTSGADDEDEDAENMYTTNEEVLALEPTIETAEQLTDQMITLSLLPKSKWQTLLNLDVIKARNKPKEAPKAPEKAPFFLSTLPGVVPKFVATAEDNSKSTDNDSKMIRMSMLQPETVFMTLLKRGHASGVTRQVINEGPESGKAIEIERDYSDFFDHLKSLNPSAVDFELRSMTLDNDLAEPRYFLEAIECLLKQRRDFELAEAYLNLFLRIHGDLLVANPEAGLEDEDEDEVDSEMESDNEEDKDDSDDSDSKGKNGKKGLLKMNLHATKAGPLTVSLRLRRLVTEHRKEWRRLEELFQSTLCLIEFMRTKA
ncbi:hypothetical protein BGZ94_004836 [Podila epigama]|nr:hypothetical protein BGZ94_004836 [Podila epigama]